MDAEAPKTDNDPKATRKISRRRFLRYSAGAAALLATGTAVDALWIEPNWLSVTRRTLPLPNLPDAWVGATIVQWTDLHVGRWVSLDDIRDITRTINALQPDIVAMTGDYVSRADAISRALSETLRNLRPKVGTYAVLGNHDFWTDAPAMIEQLASAGVEMLTNRHVTLDRNGQRLTLAGVDDLMAGQPSLTEALDGAPPDPPRVLLCHNPDFADEMASQPRVDFMLSGHTHGGQVRVPLVGAIRLPVNNRSYDAGFRQGPHCPIYICRGTGLISLPVRFNCRPELTVFTLARA